MELRVVGPEALTYPLVDSYYRAGGNAVAQTAVAQTVDSDKQALLWIGPSESVAGGHPSTDLLEHCRGVELVSLALDLPTRAQTIILPLVVTARGVLYAEAIAQSGNLYWQPEPLSDKHRQVLYRLAQSLVGVGGVPVPPGVYLVYCSVQPGRLDFARLVPYPDQSSLITLSTQTPDLFECHWRCVLGLPVVELRIDRPVAAYIGLEPDYFERVRARALLAPEASIYAPARMVSVQAVALSAAQDQLQRLLD